MSYSQLTENERYQIYTLKKAGHRQNDIAVLLDRSASTISRELQRNQGLRGYRPKQAQRLCVARRVEARKVIKVTDEVWSWIVQLIEQELSPQQVVDYLERHKKSACTMRPYTTEFTSTRHKVGSCISTYELPANLTVSGMVTMTAGGK